MKAFGQIQNDFHGLAHIAGRLNFYSPFGRKKLLEQPWLDATGIEAELQRTERLMHWLCDASNEKRIALIRNLLHQSKDISGTLHNLMAGMVLDDIELFEIKHFSLLSEQLQAVTINSPEIPQLKDLALVLHILDPQQAQIPRFYIYDEYSPALAQKRQELKLAEGEKMTRLKEECNLLEDEVRKDLSARLTPFASDIRYCYDTFAEIDLLFAKAVLFMEMQFCRPVISQDTTAYKGLFNPQIKELLQQKGKDFQPVDITLYQCPTLVTGANMAGKTVLLKTTGLAQLLFQFGFYVPAKTASIKPVQQVFRSLEDKSSTMNGLSSFAYEMKAINEILSEAKKDNDLLVLIDEPARTTNPAEGAAIVHALIDMLAGLEVRSLITTHYGNVGADCRKLNVKGLKDIGKDISLNAININDYMDYSLEENENGHVPMDALKIAGLLNVDEGLIARATKFLEKRKAD